MREVEARLYHSAASVLMVADKLDRPPRDANELRKMKELLQSVASELMALSEAIKPELRVCK